MLRSMLNVRNGPGCSRRVAASAASPRATRSCDSSSFSPSAGERRSPAAGFSSRGAMSEDKFVSFGSQSLFDGQLVKPLQPATLRVPQDELQVAGEIFDGQLG